MAGYEVLLYIGASGVAAGSLWRWIIRPLMRAGKLVNMFFEDWFGEPARPGSPQGRKGVLERLDALETKAQHTEWHLGNGDTERMRDVVTRISKDQKTFSRDQRALGKKVEGIGATTDHIDETTDRIDEPASE